jgi:Ni,Fe-hydrogenase III small subunit/NAD-dependent dihydropyrimidine dehydrogenase PreA subunit
MKLGKSLLVRASQGSQFIPDLARALPHGHRGLPIIADVPCAEGCRACVDACPTRAVEVAPVRLDLGRCVFCGQCEDACPVTTHGTKKVHFTAEPKMSTCTAEALMVTQGAAAFPPVQMNDELRTIFGRSLRMRQVSAGGCNACELELNASANVNFDVQRYGVEWVASPRHADALVVTGPLTRTMQDAVRLAWDAMPDPRFIVAVGACAISGGLYDGAPGVSRDLFKHDSPILFVPGCPPHPLTFVNAILDLLRGR